MPDMRLDIADAGELAEMLQFLADSLTRDQRRLDDSLAGFVGNRAYASQHLRDDLARFIFLLGGDTELSAAISAPAEPRVGDPEQLAVAADGSPALDMTGDLRGLIATTIGLTLVVTEHETAWDTPFAHSLAGSELAAEEASPERPEGSWPWLGAMLCARMTLRVAAEEAREFTTVLREDATSYAADVLCRGILESASLAWWLLEPGIGAERRLARWLVFRLHTAWQTKTAIGTLGLDPAEDRSEYGELPGEVERVIVGLGPAWTFTSEKMRQSCRDESWLGPAARVAGLLKHVWPQPRMPYAVLSAVAHGELAGLWRNMPPHPAGPRPAPGPASAMWLWHDAYLVLGGLQFTAGRAASFLGLDRHVAELTAWTAELDQRLPELRPTVP